MIWMGRLKKLQFLIGEHVLPYNMTVYQIRQYLLLVNDQSETDTDMETPIESASIWVQQHTIYYRPVEKDSNSASKSGQSSSSRKNRKTGILNRRYCSVGRFPSDVITDIQLADTSERVTPRLNRRKRAISRVDILKQPESIIQDFGHSKVLLEIQYENEVGTGLGTTLEFYAPVSTELQGCDLGLWNDSDIVIRTITTSRARLRRTL